MIVTTSTQLETVKKKQVAVSAVQNSRNLTADHVRSVISDIQIVEHVNVIWMELMVTFANRVMEIARVKCRTSSL